MILALMSRANSKSQEQSQLFSRPSAQGLALPYRRMWKTLHFGLFWGWEFKENKNTHFSENASANEEIIEVQRVEKSKAARIFFFRLEHAKIGRHFQIKPSSDQLLFLPESNSFVFTGQCSEEPIAVFKTQIGQFIEGSVSPPVEGADVKAIGEGIVLTTRTDKAGKYKLAFSTISIHGLHSILKDWAGLGCSSIRGSTFQRGLRIQRESEKPTQLWRCQTFTTDYQVPGQSYKVAPSRCARQYQRRCQLPVKQRHKGHWRVELYWLGKFLSIRLFTYLNNVYRHQAHTTFGQYCKSTSSIPAHSLCKSAKVKRRNWVWRRNDMHTGISQFIHFP